MLSRNGFFLLCFLFGVAPDASVAEPLDRSMDNPFVVRQSPLEAVLAEVEQTLRLSDDQERLFAALVEQLHKAARDREAASVAAAIDRNREPRPPRDPGSALRAKAECLSRYVENLRALADAEKSFFASLTDEQRRIAEVVLPEDLLASRDRFRRRGRRGGGGNG